MEYRLLTPNISDFEIKIRQFHQEIYFLLVQASVPISVWFGPAQNLMILSPTVEPENYPEGSLQLRYNIDSGYYWYRYTVTETGKKYSASELLTTEFISKDLKKELDKLYQDVLTVFDAVLDELSTAIKNDRFKHLSYTSFYIGVSDNRESYNASVALPTVGRGNMNSWDKSITIKYENGKFDRIWWYAPNRITLKDIFHQT